MSAEVQKDQDGLALVGDMGGTNARFGLVDLRSDPLRVFGAKSYLGREFRRPADAIQAYLGELGMTCRLGGAVVAVAGPVEGGAITFTNSEWSLSCDELRDLGFGAAELVNDYAALAYAAPVLRDEDVRRVGPDVPLQADRTLAVLGPGTGFGVSALARDGLATAALATEGGHIAFAPGDEVEIEILRILMKRYGRVSVERILCGRGLSELHQALLAIDGQTSDPLAQELITEQALAGDQTCLRTVERFCAILGAVAGDFALGLGARGGVFIAGGIPPKVIDILERSDFRRRFEAKGRFESYMARIPTRVIMRPHAALVGAAHSLQALLAKG